jgi:hypothetical protein
MQHDFPKQCMDPTYASKPVIAMTCMAQFNTTRLSPGAAGAAGVAGVAVEEDALQTTRRDSEGRVQRGLLLKQAQAKRDAAIAAAEVEYHTAIAALEI